MSATISNNSQWKIISSQKEPCDLAFYRDVSNYNTGHITVDMKRWNTEKFWDTTLHFFLTALIKI